MDFDIFELYTAAFYWASTTITTVGYGDIVAHSGTERIVCSIVMIIGVFIYSYTTGSLTALLSNLDSRKAKLNRKLDLLHEISKEYKLNKVFYNKLANALEYEHNRSTKEFEELINSLPSYLRNQLLIVIYEKLI
jgi:hypothetical protein